MPPLDIPSDIDADGPITLEIDPKTGGVSLSIGEPDKPAPKRRRAADFHENLAESIAEDTLGSLANWVLEGIKADEADRSEWTETVNQTAAYLGIKLTDPKQSVAEDGTVTQAVNTAMLETAVKIWSTSYAELLPVGGPVKVERKDPVPAKVPGMDSEAAAQPGQEPDTSADAQGDNLAEALEKDLNWYLTKGDKAYYPDTSRMLFNRNLIGCSFKEVYRCPVEKKPVSRWIMAQDLIVSGNPPHINAANRVTARKKVRQSVMLRMQKTGFYRDIGLVRPRGEASPTELVMNESVGLSTIPSLPRDYEHTVYECYCEIGSGNVFDLGGDLDVLDEDENGNNPGYPLPYQICVDEDSRQVLSIRRHWKRGDKDHRPKRRFVKYGFIPGFGDSFYDYGLIHLVGNPTQAATMIQRSTTDAAIYANIPAWAIAQSAASKMENTVYRPAPGEVMKVPVPAGMTSLDAALKPWPYKDPSPIALELKGQLEAQVKSLAGVIEIPVGEGRIGNTPVGTIMAYIESTTQVQGAVHKADHISQAEEFDLLRELLAETPQILWKGNKNPARKWQVRNELMDPDIGPKADPNTPSQIHRLMKEQLMVMAGGLPQFAGIANNREIFRDTVTTIKGTDAARFEMPEQAPAPPPPDPRIQAAQIKAQSDAQKTAAGIQKDQMDHAGKMEELKQQSDDKAADREAENLRALAKVDSEHRNRGAQLAEAGADQMHEAQQGAGDRAAAAQQQAQQHQHDRTTQAADHMNAALTAAKEPGSEGSSSDASS